MGNKSHFSGQKIHLSSRNLEMTSNSSQSTGPTGRVLWEELLEVILLPYIFYCKHFWRTSACVCRTSEICKWLILQDKCKIEIFFSPEMHFLLGALKVNSAPWVISNAFCRLLIF